MDQPTFSPIREENSKFLDNKQAGLSGINKRPLLLSEEVPVIPRKRKVNQRGSLNEVKTYSIIGRSLLFKGIVLTKVVTKRSGIRIVVEVSFIKQHI